MRGLRHLGRCYVGAANAASAQTFCWRVRCTSGVAPEFEHSGDKADEQHLPCLQKGAYNRSNFVKQVDSACSQKVTDCYTLQGSLGMGAFGSVCLGSHRSSGQEVAVKSIPKSAVLELDPELESLWREVKLLKLTDHPNVARLFEAYEDATHVHLVMEYCSGGELWKRILSAHECGLGFGEAELAEAARQMLRAIAYVHGQSIVHRDIKPQNFLYASEAQESELKLVDFGICGIVPSDRPEMRFLTATVGTDGYIAPEVLVSKPYGPAADMFSVGAVLHAAIVGMPPRWDPEKQAYAYPGRMRYRKLSKNAQSLLSDLLHEDPSMRPSAMEALQHPWLTKDCDPCGNLNATELASRLRSFGQRSKLERVARFALVALSRLRSEEASQLQAAFLEADVDCSGEVTQAELLSALKLRSAKGMPELESFFSALDSSMGGTITYTEFLAAAASKAWVCDSKRARQAFEMLDLDGDGFITADEISAAIPGVYAEGELEKEMRRWDITGDGQLNFEEFCGLLRG